MSCHSHGHSHGGHGHAGHSNSAANRQRLLLTLILAAGYMVPEMEAALIATPGVAEVHDLHVWTITSGMDSVSCHIVSDESLPYDKVLQSVRDVVIERFSIDHVTIQIEPEGFEEPDTPV